MSIEANKALIRRFVEEVQNQGNVELLDELAAPTFVNHSAPPGLPATIDGVKQVTQLFRMAFPDGRMTIEDMIAEGDRVVTRKTFQGTHQGSFMGMPPRGTRVQIGLIDIVRLVDGQVVEHWNVVDTLALLQQVGAIPGPQASEA